MNNGDVRERTKKFIYELGVPATVFAKKVGISATAYHRWMKNDLKLSKSTEKRIAEYLSRYGF